MTSINAQMERPQPRLRPTLAEWRDDRLFVVVAGLVDDLEDEDNRRGYEDDEAAFFALVNAAQNDACGICGFWTCRCLSGATALTDAEREELSRKNAEKNRESENRPG